MSKQQVQFEVTVPLRTVQAVFSFAINHWVENIQNRTSALAQTLISGSAASQLQKGRAFAAAIGPALARGQGAQHPTTASAKVSIPASASTYGGEMTVTAVSASDKTTSITIDGRTQGWFGGTLEENVTSLSRYLKKALPELALEVEQLQRTSAAPTNIAGEIERLSELHKAGALSDQEFAQAKKKIIDG